MFKKNKVSLVLTTINKVTKNIINIENGCKKKNWELRIVGDKKTPKNFKLNYGIFYSLSSQNKLGLNYTKRSLVNSYARKNIAYLMSIKNGADIIIETDDDNYPLKNFFDDRFLIQKFYQVKNRGWINIYDIFKRDKSLIWPRGLPLTEIIKKKKFRFKFKKNKCYIQQGLCNLNPDVDAIFRLINSKINVKFKNNLKIGISYNSITAFNSQNTTWFKEAFPLLYLPSTCTMRATDIWRSVIAQVILYNDRKDILFHSPNVFQKRNPHILMKDFKDEIPVYLDIESIYYSLKKINLKKGHQNYLSNLVKCYKHLCEEGFFEKKEMTLVNLWKKDIQKLMNII
jgi:hypothetical protein